MEKGLDVGFAFDGDADRCLCVDEKGNVITGDHILYIYLLYLGIRLNFSRGRITALGSIPIKKRKDSSWKKTQGLRLGGMRIMVLNMIELGIMEIIIKMLAFKMF